MKLITDSQKQLFMKIIAHILLSLLMAGLLSRCGDSKKETRRVDSVKLINERAITSLDDGHFYYPRYSKMGLKTFFTSANLRGIWYYDREHESIVQLNAFQGAGQQIACSEDDAKIYFKADSIGTDRRKRSFLYEQNIGSGQIKSLLGEPIRSLSHLKLIGDKYLTFLDGDRLRVIDTKTYNEEKPDLIDTPILGLYQNKILFFSKGEKSVYDPFKGSNLIWCESIPWRNECLLYVVGKGLYSLNDNGEVVGNFGDLRAARWSPDKDLIAYMQERDDGLKITGSDIFLATPDNRINLNLTNTVNQIEMYPEWSPNGREIVYHTNPGEIYMMQLEVK